MINSLIIMCNFPADIKYIFRSFNLNYEQEASEKKIVASVIKCSIYNCTGFEKNKRYIFFYSLLFCPWGQFVKYYN